VGWGWAPLDDVYEVTALPLVDPTRKLPDGTPAFARLTYRDALAVASRERAALVDSIQMEQILELGGSVPPVTLPDGAIRTAAARDPLLARRPGEPLEAWDQRLRNAGMLSLAWALHHDSEFFARLRAAGGLRNGTKANAGKIWIRGAPSGRAWLQGWWTGSEWIQQAPPANSLGFHDENHHDYATLTLLVRRRDGGPMPLGSGSSAASSGAVGGWIALAVVAAAGAALTGWYLSTHPNALRRL
jgi:hypothetical protein